MPSRFRALSFVAAVLGLAVAVGVVASSCGPKEKFCPDTSDGVCIAPMDAAVVDTGVEAPQSMDSLFIGADSM